VSVGPAKPLPDAPAGDALETLQEWKELAEPIKDGTIDVDDPAARQVIAKLRAVVEAALQAPITFDGEPMRHARVSDINIVVKQVAGSVVGVRAKSADIERVSVQGGDVAAGGTVEGVNLA
jgi:hypothetical protein